VSASQRRRQRRRRQQQQQVARLIDFIHCVRRSHLRRRSSCTTSARPPRPTPQKRAPWLPTTQRRWPRRKQWGSPRRALQWPAASAAGARTLLHRPPHGRPAGRAAGPGDSKGAGGKAAGGEGWQASVRRCCQAAAHPARTVEWRVVMAARVEKACHLRMRNEAARTSREPDNGPGEDCSAKLSKLMI